MPDRYQAFRSDRTSTLRGTPRRAPGRSATARSAQLSHPELLDALVQSAAQLQIAVLDLRNKPRRTLHFKSRDALLQALRHAATQRHLGTEAQAQAQSALAAWDAPVRQAG